MKIKKQLILKSDSLNNFYSKEVLESIRDQINSTDTDRNLGILGEQESMVTDLHNVAFTYSNAIVEDDSLYVDIDVLDTPQGLILKEINKSVSYSTCGMSRIEQNSNSNKPIVLDDYRLTTISANIKE